MNPRQVFVACVAVALSVLVSRGAQADTLLHYSFQDGSGTQATDLSGKGNHGTLTSFGDTSAGAGVFGVSEGWVAGGGLSFLDDSVRSYVQTPLSQSAVNGGDFTIEFTASADGPGDWTPAIGSDQGPGYSGGETFFLGINNGLSFIEARIPPDGGGIGSPEAAIPWTLPGDQSDDSLHHIALTCNSATTLFDLYIDGGLVGSETRGALSSALSNFIIGNTGHSFGEQWDGIITGVAISDSVLGPDTFVLTRQDDVIPEPATVSLIGLGGLLLARRRRRRP
ncbi:PEP-CTERM sorting domain-containing protein [Planctomycetota bacterium]